MADRFIPHFHNDLGVPSITVGVKEFMCTGAKPPFDHPHIFIDMGSDIEADLFLLLNQVRVRRRAERTLLARRVRVERNRVTLAAACDHCWRGNRRTCCGNSAVAGRLQCRDLRENGQARGIRSRTATHPERDPRFGSTWRARASAAVVLKATSGSGVARLGQRRTDATALGRRRTPLGRRISGHSSGRLADRAGRSCQWSTGRRIVARRDRHRICDRRRRNFGRVCNAALRRRATRPIS